MVSVESVCSETRTQVQGGNIALTFDPKDIPPELAEYFEPVAENPTNVMKLSRAGDGKWLYCGACGRFYESKSGLQKRDGKLVCVCGKTDGWTSHFATFPSSLVERCLRPIPRQVCGKCGAPFARVVNKGERRVTEAMRVAGCDSEGEYHGDNRADYTGSGAQPASDTKKRVLEAMAHGKNTLGFRPTCGCGAGDYLPDDFDVIQSPVGSRVAPDPSLETGRAGWNRPRGAEEGTSSMTRYEQRKYAEQLKASEHRAEMLDESGRDTTFAHYTRTDKSGARAIPRDLLDTWIERGWLTRVEPPKASTLPPVPATVLDPFCGTATTGVVALRMGFNFIGCELSPDYAKLSEARLAASTRQAKFDL